MGIVDFAQAGTIGASLTPKRYDISLYRGDTFQFYMVLKDANSVVIDITGWTVLCQVKELTTETIVDTPTTAVDGPNGKVTITINDSNTITEGDYRYDVQLTDGSLNKRTYIGGKLSVTTDVSN